MSTVLHIKNMVCPRCVSAVKNILSSRRLTPVSVQLGSAEVEENIDTQTLEAVRHDLESQGFELLQDHKEQIVTQIRSAVLEHVRSIDRPSDRTTLSAYVAQRVGADYSALSKLFSELTGQTIERYAILQRIERAKELITYGQLSLSQIAEELGYSSVAYLSTQFKQVTGQTPSQFKASGAGIAPLDTI